MKRLKNKIETTFFLLILFAGIRGLAFADLSPKPSLTIFVTNFDRTDYVLDLLIQQDNFFELEERYSELINDPIYLYHEDGYSALLIRSHHRVTGELTGTYDHAENHMVHRFDYFGVPDEFKIIIQKPDGQLLISELIKTTAFNAEVTIDMSSMRVTKTNNSIDNLFDTIMDGHFALSLFRNLLITLAVELTVASFFKLIKNNYLLIIFANLISQATLVALLLLLQSTMGFWAFLLAEVIVLLIEYLIYRKFFKDGSHNKVLWYVLSANLFTAGLTFFI